MIANNNHKLPIMIIGKASRLNCFSLSILQTINSFKVWFLEKFITEDTSYIIIYIIKFLKVKAFYTYTNI